MTIPLNREDAEHVFALANRSEDRTPEEQEALLHLGLTLDALVVIPQGRPRRVEVARQSYRPDRGGLEGSQEG